MMGLGIGFLVVLALMAAAKPSSAAAPAGPQPRPPEPPVPPPAPPRPVTSAPTPAPVPAPAVPTTPVVTPVVTPGAASDKYVIQAGDTGEKVALKFTGDKNRWRELLGPNPHLKDPTYGIALYTGKTITLPPSWLGLAAAPGAPPIVTPAAPAPVLSTPPTEAGKYVVKSGDTGEKIAFAFTGNKARWPELVTANPSLKDPVYGLRIYANQKINIPPSWTQQGAVSGRRWFV